MNRNSQELFAVFEIASEQRGDQQWIKLFPKGKSIARDGRVINVTDPDKIIAASKRPITEMVIDREHGHDLLPPGTFVPAAGWVKELASSQGEIWARVEWTPPAIEQLKNKELRYISPAFMADKQGNVINILRASLTNIPALEMAAVASTQTDNPNPPKTKEKISMDPSLIAIAAILGMPTDADPSNIVQGVTDLVSTVSSVGAALNCASDASKDVILASLAAKTKVDPEKYVPVGVVSALQTQLASLQKDSDQGKAETAVADAMKAGKLPPAMKEWGLELASSNLKAFNDYVAKAPVIVAAGAANPGKQAGAAAATAGEPTEADLHVASLLGVSKEAVKKVRASEAA